MNDEDGASSSSSSSSAAALPVPEHAPTPPPTGASTTAELAERRKKNRQMFQRKRGQLLDDLLRNLDILIYAELSAVYYMDCSFLRFLLRALIQFALLTPKPSLLPAQQTQDKPILGALFGSNILCLASHLYFAAPAAGEATRGYLHGGLAMDFIGQRGPASKTHLVLLDFLVVVLQVVQLATGVVRRKLTDAAASSSSSSESEGEEAPTPTPPAQQAPAQDLDAEERGVLRSTEPEQEQDIEMHNLNPSSSTAVPSTEEESAPLLNPTGPLALQPPATDAHIFHAFQNGQIVLADLDLWARLREQARMVKEARDRAASAGGAGGGVGGTQAWRAELAARVLRLRVGTDVLRESL